MTAEQTTWTPGPWYVTECDDFIRVRQESSDAVLATMEDGTHPELELVPWTEQQANARIMAASPTLYEALKGLMPTNLGSLPATMPDSATLPLDVTFGELRQAMAALKLAETGQ